MRYLVAEPCADRRRRRWRPRRRCCRARRPEATSVDGGKHNWQASEMTARTSCVMGTVGSATSAISTPKHRRRSRATAGTATKRQSSSSIPERPRRGDVSQATRRTERTTQKAGEAEEDADDDLGDSPLGGRRRRIKLVGRVAGGVDAAVAEVGVDQAGGGVGLVGPEVVGITNLSRTTSVPVGGGEAGAGESRSRAAQAKSSWPFSSAASGKDVGVSDAVVLLLVRVGGPGVEQWAKNQPKPVPGLPMGGARSAPLAKSRLS